MTRIEHHQQQPSLAVPTVTSRRSRSPSAYAASFGGSVTDLSSAATATNHPRTIYKRRSLSDISTAGRDILTSPRSYAGSQDAYIVGYATVKTHERPAGSEGVNYKVFLNQVPIGGSPSYTTHDMVSTKHVPTVASSSYHTNEFISAKPSQPRFDHSAYTSYKPRSSYHTTTSYSMSTPPASIYPTTASYPVATPPVSAYPSVSSYSSSTRRSRAPTRSMSLPRLYSSSTSSSSRSYAPSPSSATLRIMASDGPATTSTWTPWKSARPPAQRRDDEDEFYKRLREIRLRASSPVADDLDIVRSRSSRGRTGRTAAVSYSPNVIYTGKKIDYGLIPERPAPPPLPPVLAAAPAATFVDESPSKYREFQPTDVGVVVLPNGQRAVTYTHHSQTGHGDHREANVEIEKIIKKTKHLQV